MKCAAWLLLVFALTASGSEPGTPPAEDVRRAVEPRDFFLYGCVREYAKAHALPPYDSSTGYVVEFGRMTPDEMSRLYDAAKVFALTLRAPDPADEDHGGVAVMAQCMEEARSTRVDAWIKDEPKAKDAEDAAIEAVVDRAYIHGVHIDNDPELMRSGMHDSFVMFVQSDKGITQLTRDTWIERLTASKAKEPNAAKPQIKADITVLDRSGNAAVAKVALFRGGKQIFTDYISLYRFDDGWKLVAKTFHRH